MSETLTVKTRLYLKSW